MREPYDDITVGELRAKLEGVLDEYRSQGNTLLASEWAKELRLFGQIVRGLGPAITEDRQQAAMEEELTSYLVVREYIGREVYKVEARDPQDAINHVADGLAQTDDDELLEVTSTRVYLADGDQIKPVFEDLRNGEVRYG